MDDRTPAERGLTPEGGDPRLAGAGTRPLLKSRYDSVDCYLSDEVGRARRVGKSGGRASLCALCLLVSISDWFSRS